MEKCFAVATGCNSEDFSDPDNSYSWFDHVEALFHNFYEIAQLKFDGSSQYPLNVSVCIDKTNDVSFLRFRDLVNAAVGVFTGRHWSILNRAEINSSCILSSSKSWAWSMLK